jgi:general secretion pathway protein J
MIAAPSSPPRDASGESGFTLLEILVGLLVSVLIMAGLTAAMRSMSVGWGRTVDVIERQDLFANGFHIVAGDLSRIERMTDKIENPERFLFRGAPSETIFLLAERPAANSGGLYWIRLFVRSDDQGSQLVRMRAPFETRAQDFAGIEWRDAVVLLSGNFAIGFSYRAPQGGFPSWTGSWDIVSRLPEQIRVQVIDPGSGEPLIPDLIQTLGNDAEVNCIVPDDGGCTIRSKGEIVPKATQDTNQKGTQGQNG